MLKSEEKEEEENIRRFGLQWYKVFRGLVYRSNERDKGPTSFASFMCMDAWLPNLASR